MATSFVGIQDFPYTKSETGITTTTITVTDSMRRLHLRSDQTFTWSTGTSADAVPADADAWTLVWERAGNVNHRNFEVSVTLGSSGDLYMKAEGL